MTFVQWIITTGATVGAMGIIFQTLVRPVFKWAQRLEKTMTFVEQQMLPNGGSSLRDSVNRIETRLTVVEEHITLRR
jgi:hypothetical protein